MKFPDNLKYTKDHEWIRVETNEAYVGITDYAQSELGEIVFVEITTAGEALEREETFGTIEAVKTVSDLFMPVGGTVIAANPALESNPELVNSDAYGEGWLVRIEISNPAELKDLMTAAEYQAML